MFPQSLGEVRRELPESQATCLGLGDGRFFLGYLSLERTQPERK